MSDFIYINEDIELTDFQPGDEQNMVCYLNDAELYRNTLTIPKPYTLQDAELWLNKTWKSKVLYDLPTNWAIRHRTEGVIGSIGAFMKTGPKGHADEVGYWLAKPYRGQGIMTAVLRAFADWQFEHRPNLVRLTGIVFAYNPASARILEKSGFQREGYLRKYDWKDGQAIDAIMLARIREDVIS